MGTSNFYYENRCVVVTDEDYEMGNVPELGEWRQIGREGFHVLKESDFDFWDVVIESGYYSGACIDYRRNERDLEYWLGWASSYSTKKAFYKEVQEWFKISRYRLDKICGPVGDDFDAWLERSYEVLTEYFADQEREAVNDMIDHLKTDYGYEEIAYIATASNGESFYKKVG